MKSVTFIPIFLVLILLSASAEIIACSCVARPDTLEEFEQSTLVVTGRIESVQRIREKEREYDYGQFASATLVVEKVYKGTAKQGDRLVLAQGSGSNCGITWDESSVDIRMLLYLGKPSTSYAEWLINQGINVAKGAMYGVSFCGRSTSFEGGVVDLAFLDNLEKRRGYTRVYGRLMYSDESGRSVEGIEVRLNGPKSKFKSKYLKDGFFEVYDLPPDEYVLEVMAPSGWKLAPDWHASRGRFDPRATEGLTKNQRRFQVEKGGHTELTFLLMPDTLIKGKILSPTGIKMQEVCLAAVASDEEKPKYTACSDENGEFVFDSITPGNYYLLVNSDGKIDNRMPFGPFYYPGVPNRENAGLISVVAGRYNLNSNIQVPTAVRLINIFGKFLFADDKPVSEEWVSFEPKDKNRFGKISARTDGSGRFHLKVPFGSAGVISADKYFWKDDYKNCPKIVAVIEETGESRVNSSKLEITAIEQLDNAVVRLPFEYCEK